MRPSIILACIVANTGLSVATNAPVITDNPVGKTYTAKLLDKDSTTIRGTITATASKDGKGVVFDVDFSGLSECKGAAPFLYHLHEKPVPEDGNCTAAGGHIDPFNRGEQPPCNPDAPETCQVGDLSGKHGKIPMEDNGKHFMAHYTDLYASTNPSLPEFFGNRSVVVHYANGTRANCGNFVLSTGSSPTQSGNSTVAPTGTGAVTTSSSSSTAKPTTSSPPISGAIQVGASCAGVIIAALAVMVL